MNCCNAGFLYICSIFVRTMIGHRHSRRWKLTAVPLFISLSPPAHKTSRSKEQSAAPSHTLAPTLRLVYFSFFSSFHSGFCFLVKTSMNLASLSVCVWLFIQCLFLQSKSASGACTATSQGILFSLLKWVILLYYLWYSLVGNRKKIQDI